MKQLYTLIAILLLGLGTLQAQTQHYTYRLAKFNELVNKDDVSIDYVSRPDSAGFVSFESTKDFNNCLILNVDKKGKLTIQVSVMDLPKGFVMPTLRVYADSLRQVTNEGIGTVTVTDPKASAIFHARLSDNGRLVVNGLHCQNAALRITTGKGTIIANGEARELRCNNLGTGTVDALNLSAGTVSCRIVGTGSIFVNCDGTGPLNVKGTGTGTVTYRGKPTSIKVHKLGPMKVKPYSNK